MPLWPALLSPTGSKSSAFVIMLEGISIWYSTKSAYSDIWHRVVCKKTPAEVATAIISIINIMRGEFFCIFLPFLLLEPPGTR